MYIYQDEVIGALHTRDFLEQFAVTQRFLYSQSELLKSFTY